MTTTLLLNASYEPLRLIPLKRAVLLILAEKAEVIEAGEEFVRSSHLSIPLPKVIRLKYYVKVPYRARLPLNRRNVMSRDRGVCQYCFKAGDTMDHVVPRSRGGLHRWENVVTACKACNSKKGDRLLTEIGWKLKGKPSAPHGTKWIFVGVVEPDPTWTPYFAT